MGFQQNFPATLKIFVYLSQNNFRREEFLPVIFNMEFRFPCSSVGNGIFCLFFAIIMLIIECNK